MGGVLLALSGDYIGAIRSFEVALANAATPEERTAAHLARAWVAQLCGERYTLQAHLAEAWLLLAAAAAQDAGSVLAATELTIPHDLTRAQKAFQTLHLEPSSALTPRRDHVEALLREAHGERRVARACAERAYTGYASDPSEWRAAAAALLLHRLTGRAVWLDRAEPFAQRYPSGFIAQAVAAGRARSARDALTARQRAVLERIEGGDTLDQIAHALALSRNTVRIHVGRVYRAFGVSGRLELLRVLAHRARGS